MAKRFIVMMSMDDGIDSYDVELSGTYYRHRKDARDEFLRNRDRCDLAGYAMWIEEVETSEKLEKQLQREEYEETMRKFNEIQSADIFSYQAEKSRNAFERWLFCDGDRLEERLRFWDMFRESVTA